MSIEQPFIPTIRNISIEISIHIIFSLNKQSQSKSPYGNIYRFDACIVGIKNNIIIIT